MHIKTGADEKGSGESGLMCKLLCSRDITACQRAYTLTLRWRATVKSMAVAMVTVKMLFFFNVVLWLIDL